MKLRWAVPLVFFVVLALCLAGMAQNYAPATNYPTNAAPQGLSQGDFNEDGKTDIAVTNLNASSITIFPGNGDGTFGAGSAIPVAPHPFSLASGDLNGDGHLDLVVSLVSSQAFQVLLGNGNGQFQPATTFSVSGLTTGNTVGQVILKDVNGDGKPDIVLATDLGIALFINNGSGGFTQATTVDAANAIANVSVVDVDGDGVPDLVATESTFDVNANATGTVIYALGHGDGTFGPAITIANLSGPPTGLAVADFNGDGFVDIVASFASSTIQSGGVPKPTPCPIRICLPQDGGTGTTVTVPGGIALVRQISKLQFAATNSIGTDQNPGFLVVGDFDGDGRLDVAEASTAQPQILVYRGNGDGTFGAALPLSIPSSAAELATGSLTGTVAKDLFASASSTNQLSVFVNQGANTLALVSSLNPAGVSQPVTLTATVQPKFASAGTISGSVIFADGQSTLGTAAVNPSGAATLPATFTTAGDHQLTAVFGGNSSFVGGASASLVERVATVPAVTLSSSINPSSVGQAVNFTVTVAGSSSGPAPSGTITLFANGVPVLSATVDASGGAMLTTSSLPLGTNDLMAQYSGDSNYPGSDSPHISQIVNRNNSTTTLTSSVNPSSFGQAINFTVNVAPLSGNGTPTGNVTLKDAGTAIATAPLDATGAAIIAVSNLAVGTHSLTAGYAGDANFNASGSAALSQVVNATSTSVVLTDSPNPSTLGQAIVLHALVKATTGTATPSGSVVFSEGATVLGSANLDVTGTATLSITSLAIGSHNLTASYAGSASFQGSTSAAVVQVVNKNNSTATLTSSANPSSFGQAVNFTVSVTAPFNGAGTPTGNVTLKDAGTAIATAALDVTGTAVIGVTNLAAGTHPLTVDYAGDANFNVSSSASLSQVVNATSTSVVLTSSPNPSAFGQAVVLHAVVKAAVGTAAPSGSITFNDGATVLGSGNLDAAGTASLTVTSLAVGSHNLNASYAGNASFQNSTSAVAVQVVNATSTSVALTSSPNPSTSGQAVTLLAVVKAASGMAIPAGSVSFSDGTSVLGSATLDATGAASLSVTSLSVASHNLTASYAGNASFQSSASAAVVQVVNAASTSIVLTSSPNPSTTGQAVVLHAVIKAVSGTAIPSGSVAFSDGATVLGSANLDATGAASLTVTSFAIGSHTLTASYAGNANFQGSTSAAVVQVVSTSSTSVSFSTSPNPSTLGQAVALTAVVKAATGGTPAGVVVFSDGTSVLGSANLDATGTAVLTLSSFAVGSHNLTASYAGNPSFQGSTSLVVTQVVNRSAVQIAMSSSANPSVYGQSVTLQIAVTSAVTGSTQVPTGNISFTDGAAVIGQVLLDNTGHAVLTTNTLSASTHAISAAYSGDTNFLGASTSVAQVISKAATSTSLSSSINPATNASNLTLHAVVTSAAGTPSGTVQFFDGAATIGSAALDSAGSASISISNPAVGSHSLSANFTGSSNLTSSTSSAVSEAVVDSHSQVSLVSSANPQASSQPVVFTALVTPALNGQPVSGTITFRDGTQILASVPVSNGGASLSITQLAVGTHSIVASYQASAAPGPFDGISAPIAQVIQSSLAPDYSVSIQPAKGSILQGATFTTAVTVMPVNGFTGSVTLGCAGLPANASCEFVPAQIAITGQAPATSRLQIVTANYISANHVPPALAKTNWGRMMALWFAPGVFGCVLFQNRKRLRMGIVVVCVLACGLLIAGCGSSSSSRSNQTRQAHTYNVTVTAISGTVVHSTILQLTLQ